MKSLALLSSVALGVIACSAADSDNDAAPGSNAPAPSFETGQIPIAVEPANSPVITQRRAGEDLRPGKHTIQGIGAGFIRPVKRYYQRAGDPGRGRDVGAIHNTHLQAAGSAAP